MTTEPMAWENELGHYAVAFLDLLGQREAMRSISDAYRGFVERAAELGDVQLMTSPDDESRKARLEKAVRDSAVAVQEFFTRFRFFMERSEKGRQRLLEKAPQHLREKVDRASRTEFRHRRYSDGLMVSVRLAPHEDHAPMTAVWMLVSLCGHLALEQLAVGQPIRGGLDIGVGVTVSADFDREAQDHLLGPVVVGAYELESDFAKWPRIAVGDEVRTYLEKATIAPTEHVGDGGQQLARKLLNTLFMNEDGSTMIDFLGKSFRDVCGPASAENVLSANRFVLAERDRWRAVDDEQGRKLADRYATLARYFERRLHLWR